MAQHVLIIGGVALGPKAACRYKRLQPDGHVTMIDQGSYISYGGCGIPYFVSGDVGSMDALRQTSAHVIRDPEFFEKMRGVEVLTQTRALSINRQQKSVTVENTVSGEKRDLPYDKLVIATGSSPKIPPIPGHDLKNVSTVTCLEAAQAVQSACAARKIQHAVIVGGGFIGLEMAAALADQWGIQTTIIEVLDHLLPAQLSPNLAQMVRHDLEELGITVLTGEKVTELKGKDGAVCQLITDKRTLDADYVIFSVGVTPNSQIAADAGLVCHPRGGIVVNSHMQTSDPDIYAGGDCVVLRNLISGEQSYLPLGSLANRQGRVIATNLAGGDDVFEGMVGTWCVKLNKMNACGTGLTLVQARRAGFDAVAVSMEQLDRAHFYPEKNMMSLEVVVDKPSRRVLGMQGFCVDGIALKARIDAVAAMLQFARPTLNDLANLEVAYAPPFAAAMDVVNTVANVADNVLAGRHKVVGAGEFVSMWERRAENHCVVVDGRPAQAGHELAEKYPGLWLTIPMEELAERMHEIPRDRPVALICNSGSRAYDMQLKMRRAGIDSVNSEGGMQAMKKRGQTF
ncbi:MAG: FAD-dependent oxidoreductase [Desulfovibrionaceae bacterium]|nr:FAD-dependent oxidoreductase [Desulfovibrionaceae bacterium]